MKKEVGLWIDHRQAVIIRLGVQQGAIKRITSHVEKHAEESALEDDSGEDRRYKEDRRFNDDLSRYYDEVITTYLHDADAILILGPGEAKFELQKRFESQARHGQIVGVETADKMTDGQVIRKVRHHFQADQPIQTDPPNGSQHLNQSAVSWFQEKPHGRGVPDVIPKRFQRYTPLIRRSKRNDR